METKIRLSKFRNYCENPSACVGIDSLLLKIQWRSSDKVYDWKLSEVLCDKSVPRKETKDREDMEMS